MNYALVSMNKGLLYSTYRDANIDVQIYFARTSQTVLESRRIFNGNFKQKAIKDLLD